MLPSSKKSLIEAGFSSSKASWILIGCFLGGVFGIQILSRILHRFMPSHTVDCDHTHGEEEEHDHHDHEHNNAETDRSEDKNISNGQKDTERTPLLNGTSRAGNEQPTSPHPEMSESPNRRPSLHARMSTNFSKLVSRNKDECDGDGPCFGYSKPCGKECFKNISLRGGSRLPPYNGVKRPTAALRHSTAGILSHSTVRPMRSIDEEARIGNNAPRMSAVTSRARKYSDTAIPSFAAEEQVDSSPNADTHLQSQASSSTVHSEDAHSHQHDEDTEDGPLPGTHATEPQSAHHHHVPQNAFLAISMQTSIAIALHKLPEGFIQFATNHANPTLGFTVFVALAIHNISEGFALALPLYLATNSRIKALLYSVVLGGVSQPMGAGLAALWLHIAEKGRGGHNETDKQQGVYGGMFAVTAGIMASVALSLLQEGNELGHNKGLAMVFVFVGMGVMGMSAALTG